MVKELCQYDEVCRHAKDEVKNIFTARDREVSRHRHLERVRERNPRNRSQIVSLDYNTVDFLYHRMKENAKFIDKYSILNETMF